MAPLDMIRIADLARLQEIDSALDARRASLEDVQARLGADAELAEQRAVLATRAAELRTARSAQKDIELEADGLRAKIGPAETKLYSGSVKNPKELQDLQADIAQLKKHLATIEDRDLEAIGAVEAAEAAHREADELMNQMQTEWDADQSELSERARRLAAEIAVYESQREECAAQIDSGVVAVYDRLRRAHQGKGVAKLDRNLCLGCRISLPTNTVNRARAGTALVQCPNCERILHA